MTGLRGLRARRDERGAEAVEFALITVILFPLLFGIIQYGIYFNDYLQARQAVRQGARTAVVLTTPACSSYTANTADAMRCYTSNQASPVSGPVATYVGTTNATSGWTIGQPLLVCQVVKTVNVVPFIPLPNGGYALAKTQFSIEQDSTTKTGAPTGVQLSKDADPTGNNWSWCTS